jgi:hypothetical protein
MCQFVEHNYFEIVEQTAVVRYRAGALPPGGGSLQRAERPAEATAPENGGGSQHH